MNCLNINCNISGTKRMVSCWLCLGYYHLKCSGLRARDADALLDASKSIHWTCPNCRKVNTEFYNFFKSFKGEFEQLNKDFMSLQGKLIKFGEVFTKYSNLDELSKSHHNSSPKRKKLADKSPVIPIITYPSSEFPDNTSSSLLSASSLATPIKSIEPNLPLSNSVNPIPSLLVPSLGNTVESPYPSLTSISSSNNVPNPSIASFETGPEPRELRILPPRKTIFATRFYHDTTVDDIRNYMKVKFNNVIPDNVNIYKINARNRASFKIIVPVELFDQVVNTNFWPKNALVREFICREDDNVARIPVFSINSKN